jgi:hypothetical protein
VSRTLTQGDRTLLHPSQQAWTENSEESGNYAAFLPGGTLFALDIISSLIFLSHGNKKSGSDHVKLVLCFCNQHELSIKLAVKKDVA